jgi:NAD(P)-dependent dehydrogenase (short-subunit alcohol dehydrogenase family)
MNMTNLSLAGKTFIITGAGGAIASAINLAFLEAGANLALADRPGNAQIAAERLGAERAREHLGAGLAVSCDLSSLAGAQAMVQATLKHYGQVDGLIHTVGGFATGKVLETGLEVYDRMFDLNVRTLVHAVMASLPEIIKVEGGFIGGISAGQVARGAGGGAAYYTAAKAAVALFLNSLEAELSGSSTKVGVVYPMGGVDTPANRKDMPEVDPNTRIDPLEIGAAFVHMATRSKRGRIHEMQVFASR